MSITISASGLDTEQLRRAIVAHRHAVHADDAPASITATDSGGRPFVGCDGPEKWSFRSVSVSVLGGLDIVTAIAGPPADGSPLPVDCFDHLLGIEEVIV